MNLFLKEERLERLAESNKNSSINKSDEEIHPHASDPGLEFTGRYVIVSESVFF